MRVFIIAWTAATLAIAMPATAQDSISASASADTSNSGTSALASDETAARKGDVNAIRRVMQHYLDASDPKSALPWAKMGAEKDDTACQIALANLLAGGDAGPTDPVHAFMWIDIAVARHDPALGADAEAARDRIKHGLTVDQILDAKDLSAKWRATHKH
ncbi:MAG: hypothetical protein ACXU8U_06910 [Asticcacaulis sp.]